MYQTAESLRAGLPKGIGAVPLSQGDVLDGCPLVFWPDQTTEVAEGDRPHGTHARVIVLTQACDLANEKTARAIVAVVHDAWGLVQAGLVKEKFIRDNVRKGQVYGWYFLPRPSELPGLSRVIGRFEGPPHRAKGVARRVARPGQARLSTRDSLSGASRPALLGDLLAYWAPRTVRDPGVAPSIGSPLPSTSRRRREGGTRSRRPPLVESGAVDGRAGDLRRA